MLMFFLWFTTENWLWPAAGLLLFSLCFCVCANFLVFPLHIGSKRLPYLSFSTLIWHSPSSRFSWVRENVCSLRRSSSDMFNQPWAYLWSPSPILLLPLHSYIPVLNVGLSLLFTHLCSYSLKHSAAHPYCDILLLPSPPQHLAWYPW